ncbi:MAG: hypothetical protein N3D82_05125 [Ignisphaera sp.]|nr:hypothetical protein [Ignisphaera sp.]MCX8168390.1 hypothetical protein [Ignisphaera sp.]MDW8085778.1 hypothetical protein [Ignisphaera sp.]
MVGTIGLIILLFKLHSTFNEASLLAAAVIFIVVTIAGLAAAISFTGLFVDIIINVMRLIAWVLTYVGLGNLARIMHGQGQL